MPEIRFEHVDAGNIEVCRELCDELMSFQKSKAVMHKEAFDFMNFDTRMKRSFENSLRSDVWVALDGEEPVGYVFSTIDEVLEEARNAFPDWAPKTANSVGFYPEWLVLPQKIGCLSNVYFREKYRGLGLGRKLVEYTVKWLESFDDCSLTFVYISNGNDAAKLFYMNQGFEYSHEVFGGFITALYKNKG